MRRGFVVLGLAGALAAAALAAQAEGEQSAAAPPAPAASRAPGAAPQDATPQAAAPAPDAAPAPAPQVNPSLTNPILSFYPVAARAAGVEGSAVIRCKRDEHLALTGCELVSETPAGQGFGAAALAMAAKSPQNPRLRLKDADAQPAADIAVQFTLRPPYIAPDVTRMAHLVRAAEIVAKPTDAQVQAAYPPRALDNAIQGGATIECVVTDAGRLAECHVYEESPTGYGFGQAALDLAGDFTMKPRTVDGEAVTGTPVRISVAFTPNDPTAPLSLQTKPAGDASGGGGGDSAQSPH
jgi:TonB family protein